MYSYLVSIVVPIYNVDNYLVKCLNSILNQTYQNIEILLVDDGSTDSSGSICDEYALKDSRIKVIHKKNGGLSSARNAGLDIATGDYVMFVDSDDFVEPQFCEIPLQLAIEKQVDIVTFGFFRVFASDRRTESKTKEPRYLSSSEGIQQLITRNDVVYNFAWNKIYKKVLFNDVRYPFGKEYEDQAVTYLLFHKAKAIYVSDYLLYNYLFRDSSISADWNKSESIIVRFSIWLERLAFIRKYYPENENAQVKQLIDEALIGYVRLTGKLKFRKSISMFSSFMDNNKDIVLSLRKERIIKLYYFNKFLFYLYCIFYRLRYHNSND